VELVLVRHAQPDWEPEGLAVDDPGLTALGREQARRTAELLAGERFDALHVSPYRRTRETAAPIAEALGLEPRFDSWLRECGLPSLAGRTNEEVRRYFEEYHSLDFERLWDGPPGGESFRHFYERVSSGIEGLLVGDHRLRIHEDAGQRLWRVPDEGRRLLLVAHEGTISVVVSHLLGVEPVPWTFLRFSNAWAGVTRLDVRRVSSGLVWSLACFNRLRHLEGLPEA
jgi:broad specificity phosphatase PhoE